MDETTWSERPDQGWVGEGGEEQVGFAQPWGQDTEPRRRLVEACIRTGPGLACWGGYHYRVFLARCWGEFSRDPRSSNLIYDDSWHPSGIETFLVARGSWVCYSPARQTTKAEPGGGQAQGGRGCGCGGAMVRVLAMEEGCSGRSSRVLWDLKAEALRLCGNYRIGPGVRGENKVRG